MGVVPSLWLSWSSARLLALTLNSLCGLLQFLQSGPAQQDLASFDTLLALRLIQESLVSMDPIASSGGFDPDIFKAMRNLSAQLEQVAARGRAAAEKAEPLLFKKFESLLTVRSRPKLGEVKLLDEMLRWREKEQQSPSVEGQRPEEPWIIWRPENILQRCLFSRLDCCNCSLPIECEQRLASKGLVGFELDKQVLLALLLAEQSGKCPQKEVPEFLEEYFAERCANMWDDLNALTQKRRSGIRQLARMNVRTLGLLLEQVYLCGHIGFAQFANPHLLLTLLSWQNPELGCWTAERADPVTEFGIKAAVEFYQLAAAKEKIQRRREEEGSCLVHISLLAGLALSGVYLRFLLDPGPWPDQHGLSQLVQLDGVPSEDKFQAFPYLKWVRDSDIAAPGQGGGAVRLLRPPPSNWSPDLIAFVCLLFVIVLGVVLAIHFCGDDDRPGTARKGGPGRKKMYPYAFKRL